MPKAFRKKKKFINKKEATTYRLIPGYIEEDDSSEVLSKEELEVRKEEERKYGIFFDDTYNYMKHLRSLNEQSTLVSSEQFTLVRDDESLSTCDVPVFKEFLSSDVSEEKEIDSDVLVALDTAPVVRFDDTEIIEDGEFLDDDFISKAGGVVFEEVHASDSDNSLYESESEITDDDDDSECSELPSHDRGTLQDEIVEAQTALILKNFEEGLGFRCSNQSDDETEHVTAEDYENLKQILNQDKSSEKETSWVEVLDNKEERVKIDTSRYQYDDVDEFEWKEISAPKVKFDCVSILSLNSNTRNLPTDLIPPKVKTKKPSSVSDSERSQQGLSLKQLEKEIHQSRNTDKASTFRPKDETKEERKARKKVLKEERKDRRQEKKANKEVFSLENEKMKKETAALHKAVKSVKIC
ncbi:protein LTV1 homolog [Biomphalaria glabrata]|uniref:Protein LTV1 homolog n=1 Tax=Biomphalaria glabrata TaxID=6526 RepID=A0A9W3AAZ0_BIOGL|nr:protein LTV1 homolog [Biomphalaria glabrata]